MATTTNFGWETPDDTDLVKDGALAIRTLGNSIDTSLVDLKGGTTGQVLSKTSNTDMDFTWVTSDDANAIQNAIVDAKGDLIAASAADTPARLAVGNNGETLVADSSTSTGLRWQGLFAAGKNKIINGDFNINQRNASSTTQSDAYIFDRWLQQYGGAVASVTYSTQNFTLGTAPVAGYEGKSFARQVTTSQTNAGDYAYLVQRIESVRTLANQTVVVSFWAKAASGTPKVSVEFTQYFGTGGSPSSVVRNYIGQVTLSTSWTRYSVSASIASISGKTIGTNNDDWLGLYLWTSAGTDFNSRTNSMGIQNNTFDFWGVQVEQGSVATPFQTATGTLAGELCAAQRYYYRHITGNTQAISMASAYTASIAIGYVQFPATMRVAPTTACVSGTDYYSFVRNGTADQFNSFTLDQPTTTGTFIFNNSEIASTAGQAGHFQSNNASSFVAFQAEL